MTTLHVTDQNTGEIVEINLESPSGSLYVRDAEGNLIQLDLNSPSGTVKVIDADTGNTLTLDYSNPNIVVTVIDPNTGQFVDIDFSNASGNLYAIDENTGEFVLVNVASARFVNSIRGIPLAIPSDEPPTYHLSFDGVDDKVTIQPSTSLNNLILHDFTIDWVFQAPAAFENAGYLIGKSDNNNVGLEIWVENSEDFGCWVSFSTYDGANYPYYFDIDDLGEGFFTTMRHYEISYDSSERTGKLFIDGVEIDIIPHTDPTFDYDDSGFVLDIAKLYVSFSLSLEMSLRWLRISDTQRHTSNFTPPSLTICPPADANTILRLALDEGSGGTANDTSDNNNNGIITGATWEVD